ncbi:MAG: GNAT family N-acetyltransferase [Anaerolineae bacterium]
MKITTSDEGRAHKREMWIEGEEKPVCNLWVIDFTMRVGTTVVRMAGIGGVHTEREHRMKGYMRHLFEDTVHYMIAEGYDISMLFGIENFYTKFGYAAGLASFECKVKTRDAEVAGEQAGGTYITRPIGEADMPAVLDLYNANNAMRVCSVVRAPEDFTKFEKGTWYGTRPDTQLWEDANGKLLAYAVWDHFDKAVKVAEVEVRDDAALPCNDLFPALLSFFAAQAVEKRCEDVQLFIPPDHPFAEYVQRFGAEWMVTYPRYGSGMLRLLNQQPFFEKLAPELERRLALAHSAGYTGTLTFQTDLGTLALIINRGSIAVTGKASDGLRLELSQDKLTQLVIGYRSARDVLNDPQVTAHGDVLPLLNALFPQGQPYIWVADHF